MEYTFVLKDKGTKNQGWWLKIDSIEKLLDYNRKTNPTTYRHIMENYLRGKEYNRYSMEHSPHIKEDPITLAVVMRSSRKKQNIFNGIIDFEAMVTNQQINTIVQTGCIYINPLGGYHGAYPDEPKYDFVRTKEFVFPEFTEKQIRIKQFTNGTHYYAYIDKTQVRDGDKLKWDTYKDAYEYAKSLLTS